MPPKRRRTKGTGYTFLRGNVYWIEYQERGRRLRESAHTGDQEVAERYLKQRIGEVAVAGGIVRSRATIADLCQLVTADYQLRGLRDLPRVKWRMEAHIERLLGPLAASRFGPAQVRIYVATRQTEKATNGTINRELGILRRAFTLGQREEPPLVRKAPHIPKLEEAEPRKGFIERPQYELLLAHLPERLKCLLVVGYHFGCRMGELRKLLWGQVDFEAGTITIEAAQAKSKTSRVLPFYGDVREWMERQRDYCQGDRVFCFRPSPTGPQEMALGRSLRGWDAACTAAGLPGLLFHDLRRSAVRNLVRAGNPESVARKISGHKTASVFQRYNIVSDGDLADAAKRMDEFAKDQRAKLKLLKRG